MKTCFKCHQSKPMTDFYKHSKMSDGHLGKCKECTCRDVRFNRVANVEYYQAYDRVRFHENGARGASSPEAKRRGSDAWIERNREKRMAHYAVSNAVRDGKLVKPGKCSTCENTSYIHGHHDDYSKPLDVRWLCSKCHSEHHRKHDIEADKALLADRRKTG